MGNRFLLWLGAGAVCAGVTVGMLAGAGSAFAQTGSSGDSEAKTSQSAEASESQKDSVKDAEATADTTRTLERDVVRAVSSVTEAVDDAVTTVVKTAGDNREQAVARTFGTRTSANLEPRRQAAAFVNDVVAAVTHIPDRMAAIDRTRRTDPADKPVDTLDTAGPDVTIDAVTMTPSAVPDNPTRRSPERVIQAFTPTRSNLTLQTPALTQPTATVEAVASPTFDLPPVISALGTAVFGLISLAESVFEGPPIALPGSGVRVERSTLRIGDQEVPADWYFPDTYDPDSETPPERIIYLQHGFGARGVFYDYTASYLAQQTNSVVVAPSVTSNLFATDGMWLGGDPMHRAMADLFLDDNPALLDSARAAGYTQDQLPQQVVLVGHSLGGGAVLNMARYMAADERSSNPRSSYQLAGVMMLDGVSFTDPALHIAEIPDDIPVYNLSSTPNPWNLFGTMDAALARERPTSFHGAQMLLGWHSDAMVGGNPLVQLAAYAITGYGGPANVEGSQILAASWINDMFDGERTCTDSSCYYGAPGGSFVISTNFGPAIGLVAPRLDPVNSFLSQATLAFFGLTSLINYATDAEEQPTSVPASSGAIAA